MAKPWKTKVTPCDMHGTLYIAKGVHLVRVSGREARLLTPDGEFVFRANSPYAEIDWLGIDLEQAVVPWQPATDSSER